MHTASFASRTCMASASAVEWTATVLMPISRQARWMRSAISPRLAISTLSNMPGRVRGRSLDDHQNFAIFHGAAVLDVGFRNRAAMRRGARVPHLPRYDDEQRLALGDRKSTRLNSSH